MKKKTWSKGTVPIYTVMFNEHDFRVWNPNTSRWNRWEGNENAKAVASWKKLMSKVFFIIAESNIALSLD